MSDPHPQADVLPRLPELPHLADVVPAVLASLGVPGMDRRIELPAEVRGACVLLIDGLGAEQLDAHVEDAPVLAGLRAGRLKVGYPSTTAAGVSAVGTGCSSGEHGMVGYAFRAPYPTRPVDSDAPIEAAGADTVLLNALRWCRYPDFEDLLSEVVPEQLQPVPTMFERAAAAGIDTRVVNYAQFAGSGLSRAVLRGGRYHGVHGPGDLIAAVRSSLTDGGFCYGYHSDLDTMGHLYGPASEPWRMQLRQIDRLIESIVDGLPAETLVAVVADHGMMAPTADRALDIDATPDLHEGVHAIAGEPRARHVYTNDGALDDVLATWREIVGDRGLVVEREEAIAAGWFGPRIRDGVRDRLGDVMVAASDTATLLRRTVEPHASSLRGHHGSMTPAEIFVPLLLAGV